MCYLARYCAVTSVDALDHTATPPEEGMQRPRETSLLRSVVCGTLAGGALIAVPLMAAILVCLALPQMRNVGWGYVNLLGLLVILGPFIALPAGFLAGAAAGWLLWKRRAKKTDQTKARAPLAALLSVPAIAVVLTIVAGGLTLQYLAHVDRPDYLRELQSKEIQQMQQKQK